MGESARPSVLVTGAGGFVGARVARAFTDAGWDVAALVRRPPATGVLPPGARVVVTDLRRCEGVPPRFDCLAHCAADVPARTPDAAELVRSNVEGTARVLEAAAAARARSVLYLSSMSAFGKIAVPVVDEATPQGELDDYGRSKAEGERLVAEWTARTGGGAVSIRLPGVVGAGGRNNFLCDTLLRVMRDEPVTARNPEAAFNNVLHVADLARFLVQLAARDLPRENTLLTLASEGALRLREVLELLYRAAGHTPRLSWAPPGGNPFTIAFARAVSLGYRPASVADSVERFVAEVRAAGSAA